MEGIYSVFYISLVHDNTGYVRAGEQTHSHSTIKVPLRSKWFISDVFVRTSTGGRFRTVVCGEPFVCMDSELPHPLYREGVLCVCISAMNAFSFASYVP